MSRARFVRTDARASDLLAFWLDLHHEPIPEAELTLRWLRERADWKTRVVKGSDRQLVAERPGMSRNKFKRHTDLLADLGLLTRVEGGWAVPEDVEQWLQTGEPFPAALLGRLTAIGWLTGAFDSGEMRKSWTGGLRSGFAVNSSRLHGEATDVHDEATLAPSRSHTGSVVEPPHAASPGETPPVEVEDLAEPVEVRGSDLDRVLQGLSACCGGKTIGKNKTTTLAVAELLGRGWTVEEIVNEVAQLARFKREVTPGIVIRMLQQDLPDVPPRLKVQRDRERERAERKAKEAAPDCRHEVPNGTYVSPRIGEPICPECRAEHRRRLAEEEGTDSRAGTEAEHGPGGRAAL